MRVEHEMLRVYTFVVMTSVILSGGLKMRDEHGMLSEGYIFVMTSVILSGRAWNAWGSIPILS